MKPYIFAAFVALTAIIGTAYLDQHHNGPTFAQRWAPVELIDGGVKGDRLDRKPLHEPPASVLKAVPRNNWLANPRLDTRIACLSFCDYP